jgi:hypothetical protein
MMTVDRWVFVGFAAAALAASGCSREGGSDASASADTTYIPVEQAPSAAPAASPDTQAADAPTSTAWVLDEGGIGPVRVGMTADEAKTALGGGFNPTGDPACQYVRLGDEHPGVAVMLEKGKVVRVDVDRGTEATTTGVRIGDTAARVEEAYPNPRVMPHKYTAGQYIVAIPGAPADTMRRVVFETDSAGTVTRFRGGVYPAVEHVEVCS